MQSNQVICPQIRGNMRGALVRENGVIRELPVELPEGGVEQALRRIENVARQMAGILVARGYPVTEAKAHARAIEGDLARVRELL